MPRQHARQWHAVARGDVLAVPSGKLAFVCRMDAT
jgi:hypothetical protein